MFDEGGPGRGSGDECIINCVKSFQPKRKVKE